MVRENGTKRVLHESVKMLWVNQIVAPNFLLKLSNRRFKDLEIYMGVIS